MRIGSQRRIKAAVIVATMCNYPTTTPNMDASCNASYSVSQSGVHSSLGVLGVIAGDAWAELKKNKQFLLRKKTISLNLFL